MILAQMRIKVHKESIVNFQKYLDRHSESIHLDMQSLLARLK